jgi:hypothetical protein
LTFHGIDYSRPVIFDPSEPGQFRVVGYNSSGDLVCYETDKRDVGDALPLLLASRPIALDAKTLQVLRRYVDTARWDSVLGAAAIAYGKGLIPKPTLSIATLTETLGVPAGTAEVLSLPADYHHLAAALNVYTVLEWLMPWNEERQAECGYASMVLDPVTVEFSRPNLIAFIQVKTAQCDELKRDLEKLVKGKLSTSAIHGSVSTLVERAAGVTRPVGGWTFEAVDRLASVTAHPAMFVWRAWRIAFAAKEWAQQILVNPIVHFELTSPWPFTNGGVGVKPNVPAEASEVFICAPGVYTPRKLDTYEQWREYKASAKLNSKDIPFPHGVFTVGG